MIFKLWNKFVQKHLTNVKKSYIMIGRERNGSGSSRKYLEKYSRGRRGAPAKGVGRIYPAREFKSLLLRQKSTIVLIRNCRAFFLSLFYLHFEDDVI